jgi:hypothetical protein
VIDDAGCDPLDREATSTLGCSDEVEEIEPDFSRPFILNSVETVVEESGVDDVTPVPDEMVEEKLREVGRAPGVGVADDISVASED